jgi:hypothetical protein
MFGRFAFLAIVPFATAVFGTVGCAQDPSQETQEEFGRIGVTASALTDGSLITSMVVESGSAVSTLTYDSSKSKYTGGIVLPVGKQTITVKAYASSTQVGLGTADVVIEANKTAAITVRVLDTTGGNPQPDAGPFIVSLTSSSASTAVGQAVALAANAVDANGDRLSYSWASSCGGTFSSQTAASTSWQPDTVGPCKITVTVTSNSLSDAESVDLIVFPEGSNDGATTIEADYVPSPAIYEIEVGNCEIYAYSDNSMCPAALSTNPMGVSISYSAYAAATISLTDNCGGTITQNWTGYYGYTPVPGLCTLTATLSTTDGASTSLSASFYVK